MDGCAWERLRREFKPFGSQTIEIGDGVSDHVEALSENDVLVLHTKIPDERASAGEELGCSDKGGRVCCAAAVFEAAERAAAKPLRETSDSL
jgi:hypothetical protein